MQSVKFAFTAALCSVVQLANVEAKETPEQTLLKPIRFIEYDLENGLHVILHENHAVPVVTTYVLYHVGSKNERPDRTGFAHFFEHLMFEGSENIPRGKIDKFVSGAGGNLNASTSFDRTDYYFNLPANELKLGLWIESERMMHAKIDELGVETQRKVVKEEKRRGVDNQPYGTLFEEFAKLVFRGTPYEWVPIGSFQYIDQATIEEFRQFYKTYYQPNNATLAIAGDFDLESTKKLVTGYFAAIPRGPEIVRPKFDQPPQTEPEKRDIVKENTPLPATLHAWRAVVETHPDAYAVELLGNILSSGHSSRLYKRLVEEERAALEVECFPYLMEQVGMIGVFATGKRGVSLDRLDALVAEEVEKVKKDGVTTDEFQKVLNQKEAEFANAFGSIHTRAENLARYHVFFGDTNLINTELNRYLAVRPEDLKRVANQYLTSNGLDVLRFPVPANASAPAPAPSPVP